MMGKSSSNSFGKAKNNLRDRDKQNSAQSNPDAGNQHNTQKDFTNKVQLHLLSDRKELEFRVFVMCCLQGGAKYIGLAPESIVFCCQGELISSQAVNIFTEDINYKLRQVIYVSITVLWNWQPTAILWGR